MPPRKRQRSAMQCVYSDGTRRCTRNGFGNPSLCRTHMFAMHDASSRGAKPSRPREAVSNLAEVIDQMRRGKRVDTESAIGAAAEVLGAFFSAADPGRSRPGHPFQFPDFAAHQFYPDRFRPPGQQQRRPPQIDQHQADLRRARHVLEIPPGVALTEPDIKGAQRRLARKHHPDLGGPHHPAELAARTTRMGAINAAADLLAAELR